MLKMRNFIYLSFLGLRNLPKTLCVLDLYCCNNITNDGFKDLPPKLQNLALWGLKVNYVAFQNLPNNMDSLSLSNLQITDQDLLYLPKSLRSLSIRNCKFISPAAFPFLPKSLEDLEIIDCSITQQEVLEFLSSNRNNERVKKIKI